MNINDTCLCGGYWDWVKEDLQQEFSTKPSLIPFELDAPSKINGWVWTYICNENCAEKNIDSEDLVINSLESLKALFPGGGGSSSSSDDKKCSMCGAGRGAPHKRTACKFIWPRYVDPAGYE